MDTIGPIFIQFRMRHAKFISNKDYINNQSVIVVWLVDVRSCLVDSFRWL